MCWPADPPVRCTVMWPWHIMTWQTSTYVIKTPLHWRVFSMMTLRCVCLSVANVDAWLAFGRGRHCSVMQLYRLGLSGQYTCYATHPESFESRFDRRRRVADVSRGCVHATDKRHNAVRLAPWWRGRGWAKQPGVWWGSRAQCFTDDRVISLVRKIIHRLCLCNYVHLTQDQWQWVTLTFDLDFRLAKVQLNFGLRLSLSKSQKVKWLKLSLPSKFDRLKSVSST